MTPPRPLRTFSKLSGDKQQRVLLVALEEFSENGFQGTSINTIVRRLGIAKGSIFQYFKDKEGLFLFVFDIALEKVKNYLRDVRDQTAGQDFFTRLERILNAGVGFIDAHPMIYRLYLRVLFESQIPFRRDILSAIRRYSHEYLRELVDDALECGELRPDIDVDKTAFILDAVMDRFLQAQCVDHLDAGLGLFGADAESTRRWVSQIVDLVRIGVDAGGRTGRNEPAAPRH
ncbi:MAG: TetR/AcrR family transcriptional regulator [Desulfobacterales bacterium]